MNRLIVNNTINLNGATLEFLPQTFLVFEGGKYENGRLIGNHTYISAPPSRIFGDNLTLEGTWDIEHAYFEWFGASEEGSDDDTNAFNRGIASQFNHFKLLSRTYTLGPTPQKTYAIDITRPLYIEGTAFGNILQGGTGSQLKAKPESYLGALIRISSQNVVLRNLELYGTSVTEGVYNVDNIITGNANSSLINIQLDNLTIGNCNRSGVDMACILSKIDHVHVQNCFCGIYLHRNESLVSVTSTIISDCYVKAAKDCAYDIRNGMYTTLISCATDVSANEKETLSDKSNKERSGFAYSLFACQGVSLVSCGCEESYQFIKLDSCSGVTIQSMFEWCQLRKGNIPSGYSNERQIELVNCNAVAFQNCIMGMRVSGQTMIYQYNSRNIVFQNNRTRNAENKFEDSPIASNDIHVVNNRNFI